MYTLALGPNLCAVVSEHSTLAEAIRALEAKYPRNEHADPLRILRADGTDCRVEIDDDTGECFWAPTA
jgi:hypothetical protein